MDAAPRLDDLIKQVRNEHPDGNPLEHLSEAVLVGEHLGEVADGLIGYFVDQARRAGASWTEIGRSMGVTKQAAQKRFVDRSWGDPYAGKFASFTDRARRAIMAAQEEARKAGNTHVGTEHVVLGILHQHPNIATRAILALGVTTEAVRDTAAALVGPRQEDLPEHIPFSPGAKKLLELSVREALRFGHNYVGTEHMLLGMLRDRKTPVAKALVRLGITLDAADREITRLLK
jgi:Clp amino terminal domain, pathogenicity island component